MIFTSYTYIAFLLAVFFLHWSAPVAARILYPFDQGPLDTLTASGSVPGLTLIAPSVTAEFGGPASYGFRAGTGRDAPGYTICIGLPAGG